MKWLKKVKEYIGIFLLLIIMLHRCFPPVLADDSETAPGADNIPVIVTVSGDSGNVYYIVDHSQYVPDLAAWDYRIEEGGYEDRQISFLTNGAGSVKILYLMDAEGNFYPYAYNDENRVLYPCHETVSNGQTFLYMSPYACSEWPEGLAPEAIAGDFVFYGMDMRGNGGFYRFDDNYNLVKWDSDGPGTASADQTIKLLYIFCIAAGMIAVTICFSTFQSIQHQRRRRQRRYQQYQQRKERLEREAEGWAAIVDYEYDYDEYDYNSDEYDYEFEEEPNAEKKSRNTEPPVISVQDVTMIFHISTSNASGIKEYIIQWLKHKVTFRELVALDHVSFDVFKGEVVGVIGTNGSGKSTLLRIVSGALNPTGGRVLADRRKVQLLTLGTGFDMELSARENVYLNGSIIGYSKKFLDEHYNEIVEFAELQDFMDEKVKNFSSGMVSRLGFAIATAGDAAEILILDEVLSVGDEFFRKKSLNRIKEMIHGGSTVLMVSHGMGTILEHCTKVVWIEKGKLMMVGEAKMVCGAYQRKNG